VAATICPHPVTLNFDLLTLKSVWESHVTWGTPVRSFIFLGLLVFELEPMYATSYRQTDGRRTRDDRLMPPPTGRGIMKLALKLIVFIYVNGEYWVSHRYYSVNSQIVDVVHHKTVYESMFESIGNVNLRYQKLSCRRETAQRFVSLNILLRYSRSFEITISNNVE